MRRIRAILSALVLANLTLGPMAFAAVPHDANSDAIGRQIYDWQQEIGQAFTDQYETETDTSVLSSVMTGVAVAQAQALAKAIGDHYPYYYGTWSATGTETSPSIDRSVPAMLMEVNAGGGYVGVWWKTGANPTDWQPIAGAAAMQGSVSVSGDIAIRASTSTTTSTGPVKVSDNPVIVAPTDLVHQTATIGAADGLAVRADTGTSTGTSTSLGASPVVVPVYGTTVQPLDTSSASGTTKQPADSGHKHALPTDLVRDTDTRLGVSSAVIKAGPGIVLKGTDTNTVTQANVRDNPTVQVDASIVRKTDAEITTNTNDVTSTGLTSGVVPVANGTRSLKDSQLFDNGTGVGVGSSSIPSDAKFDVYTTMASGPQLSLRGDFHLAGRWGGIRFGDYTQTTDYQKGGIFFVSRTAYGQGDLYFSLENTDGSGSATPSNWKLKLATEGDLTVYRNIIAANIVTTPTASAIPLAYTNHTIDDGWLSTSIVRTTDTRLALATSAITGTGTTGYHLKFVGTRAAGDSIVYDNGTNVGIGTNAPQAKLDIYDDTTTAGPQLSIRGNFHTLDNYGGIRFGDYTQTTTYQKGGVFFKSRGTSANGDLIFALNSAANSTSVTDADWKLKLAMEGDLVVYRNIVAANIGTTPGTNLIPNTGSAGNLDSWISYSGSVITGSPATSYIPYVDSTRHLANSPLYLSGGALHTDSYGLTLGGPLSASNVATTGANNILKIGSNGLINGTVIPFESTYSPKSVGGGSPTYGSSGWVARADHRHAAPWQQGWVRRYGTDSGTFFVDQSGNDQFAAQWPIDLSELPSSLKIKMNIAGNGPSGNSATLFVTVYIGPLTDMYSSVAGSSVTAINSASVGMGQNSKVSTQLTGTFTAPSANTCSTDCILRVVSHFSGSYSGATFEGVTITVAGND